MTWLEYATLVCKICLYEDTTHQKHAWINELAKWVLQVKETGVPSAKQLEYEYFSAFESASECAWTTSQFWSSIDEDTYEALPPRENYLRATRIVYEFAEVFQPWCFEFFKSETQLTLDEIANKINEFTSLKEGSGDV